MISIWVCSGKTEHQYKPFHTCGSCGLAPDGYGDFRKTAALAYVRNAGPKIVTFTAHIPETALWKLDYYIPYVQERDGQKGLEYNLVVTNGSSFLNVDQSVYNRNLGWNEVGDFDLDEGEVRLEIGGRSQRGPLWADAIRWSKVEND